jgi:hypothetical protein
MPRLIVQRHNQEFPAANMALVRSDYGSAARRGAYRWRHIRVAGLAVEFLGRFQRTHILFYPHSSLVEHRLFSGHVYIL